MFIEISSKKLYKEYSAKIPYQDVANIIDERILKILPTVELPGFRKGKAPLAIVKKKYENNILSEVIENIAKENTQKLLDEKKLKPIRQPKVEVTKYEKNSPLELKFKIDLEPEINLIDFTKVKTKKYVIQIEKKEYEENYKKFIDSQTNFEKIKENREVKKGDKVVISLRSKDKLVPDFLKQDNIPIYTESDYQILKGIDQVLIDKKSKVGDKIQSSFDIKEIIKDKKEKLTSFDIEIISIEEKIELKINKDYLNKNNFKSEKDLIEKVNSNFKEQYNKLVKEVEKKQLYDVLEKKHNFDIPEGIFDEEFNQIWHRVEHAKKDSKLDEDDKKLSDKDLKERYTEIATRRVKLAIIIQKIANNESINVSNEELTNGLLEYASQYPGQEKQIFEFFKKNPAQIESIKAPIFENKVLERLLDKTIRENQNITVKEFINLQSKTFKFNEKK
tara:strand:- start:3805 stop:5148 length:1344 start_codon:yes stop_codon:yes gene_type:complete